MGPTPQMDSEYQSLERQLAAAQETVAELRLSLQTSLSEKAAAKRDSEVNSEKMAVTRKEMEAIVYAINHDLKQPLRSILTTAQLLERRNPELTQVKEFASYVVDGVAEITSLIEGIARFSQAGSSLRRSDLNLKYMVDMATFKVQTLLKETGGRVVIGDLPTVAVDESQFTAVFEHLLTNALRYRGEEAPLIEITSEANNELFVISVRDNGQGIEEKYQQQIFEPLKRLHGKQIPGAGLGLAICQKIVRAHDGRIWVESDGEHGSTFRFTVPA